MKTSEVLNRAADLIEERGHVGGRGWPGAPDFDGRLCLEGGIMAALGMEWDSGTLGTLWACPAHRAVRAYLNGRLPFMWQDDLPYGHNQEPPIPGWVGGSQEAARAYAKERVIEVLRAAAVIEAAREEQDAAWETYAELVTA